MNKAIIVIGSSGSGKTTFIKGLLENYNELDSFHWVNIDFIVENKDHKFYNNPLQANKFINNEVIPEIIEGGMDFIWDCTGANIKPIKKIIEDNPKYEFKIIVHYCEPVISYIRNFQRDRKVPKQVVIQNWMDVYCQMEEYTNLIGFSNIYTHETSYSDEENKILDMGWLPSISITQYNNKNNTDSSFKKEETTYSITEILEKQSKFSKLLHILDESYIDIQEDIEYFQIENTITKSLPKKLYKWVTK